MWGKEQLWDSWMSIYFGEKQDKTLSFSLKIAWTILVFWEHLVGSLLKNTILKFPICML